MRMRIGSNLRRSSSTALNSDLMSRKTHKASAIAVAATVLTILFSAEGSGAYAQDKLLGIIEEASQPAHPAPGTGTGIASVAGPDGVDPAGPARIRFVTREVVQPLPADYGKAPAIQADGEANPDANSLAELVETMPQPGNLSNEMRCLAGAIYFESKGEPLNGQLAVGRVIVNRSESGRFPADYCGVVYQPSQFSFVRGGRMPAINTGSRAWREAVAIAQIADKDLWDSPAEGALFFHARHVSPGWQLRRVAQVRNHIFYR